MSNLVNHAEREMKLAGLYDSGADYGGMIPEAVMKLVKIHAAEGHSGGSHSLVLEIFNRVINFKRLSPLTPDPSEWNDVSAASGRPLWQSARQSSVFSQDGGKTHYDIEDPEKKNWPVRS